MAKFESALGNNDVRVKKIRDYEVADETGIDLSALSHFTQQIEDPEVEKQIRAAKEARQNPGKERLSEGARNRIEKLIGMSKPFREVEIEGNVYRFESLTGAQSREIWIAAMPFEGSHEMLFEMRRQVLARSLIKINMFSFEEFIGSFKLIDKLEFLDTLPEALLLRLNEEYSLMIKQSQERFAIKTEEDAQQVVEDLKK